MIVGLGLRNNLPVILQEELYNISENQKEKDKYTHDYFISVLC